MSLETLMGWWLHASLSCIEEDGVSKHRTPQKESDQRPSNNKHLLYHTQQGNKP